MARILVTGGSGFVGSFLRERLILEGHDVVGTTHGTPSAGLRYCNIEDRSGVEATLHELSPDIVIHCAAISSVTAGRAMDYYRVNTVATENLIEAFASRGGQRFVFISTAGVYGNQEVENLHEKLCPKPVHHYGMSKLCCERLLYNYADRIDFSIIRPFNIVGEGQNGEFIVPKLVEAFHRRLPVVKLGNLDVYRDYIDVLDAVEIIDRLIFSPDANRETVNLCSGRPVSINDLISALTAITGHKIDVQVAPEFVRRNEVWRLLGDATKLTRLMGGDLPLRPVEQTLERMLVTLEAAERDSR